MFQKRSQNFYLICFCAVYIFIFRSGRNYRYDLFIFSPASPELFQNKKSVKGDGTKTGNLEQKCGRQFFLTTTVGPILICFPICMERATEGGNSYICWYICPYLYFFNEKSAIKISIILDSINRLSDDSITLKN